MAGDMLSTLKKISTIFFKGTVLEAMKQTEEIFHHGHGWGGIEESSSGPKII
jgi:hypothetical protein